MSIRKAQDLAYCPLCDNKNPLKWKCLNCVINLCDDCKRSHERIPATKAHHVVNISDSRGFPNIQTSGECSIHKLAVTMFCSNCKIFVCNECITGDHNSHTFEKSQTVHRRLLTECESFITAIEKNKRPDAQKVLLQLQQSEQSYRSQSSAVKERVIERELKIKQSIESKRESILSKINEITQKQLSDNAISQVEVKNQLENLDVQEALLRSLLKNNDPQMLMSQFSDINNQLNVEVLKIKDETSGISFHAGRIDEKYLTKMYGCVEYNSTIRGRNSGNFILAVKDVIATNTMKLDLLCANDENSAWVGNLEIKGISLVSFNGIDMSSRTLEIIPRDFTITTDGTLLISDKADGIVKTVTANNSFKTIFNVAPLKTLSIYGIEGNEVLASVIDKKNFQVKSTSIRKIVQFDLNGQTNFEIQKDKNGTNIFTLPVRCVFNKVTKNFVVLDKTNSESSRVLSITRDSVVRFVYAGSHGNKTQGGSLECTLDGLIIMAETKNDFIHIIDVNGECVSLISTSETQLARPKAISLTSEGYVLVGSSERLPKHAKSKISIVKLLTTD